MKKYFTKSILVIALAAVMLFMAACGPKDGDKDTTKTDGTATESAQTTEVTFTESDSNKTDKDPEESETTKTMPEEVFSGEKSELLQGKFKLDGKDLQLPVSFTEIQALGWLIEDPEISEKTSVNDITGGEVLLLKQVEGQEKHLLVTLAATSDEKSEVGEAMVYKIETSKTVHREDSVLDNIDADLVLPGDLHAFDDLDAFKAKYGEPDYSGEVDGETQYGYGVIDKDANGNILRSGLLFTPGNTITLAVEQN